MFFGFGHSATWATSRPMLYPLSHYVNNAEVILVGTVLDKQTLPPSQRDGRISTYNVKIQNLLKGATKDVLIAVRKTGMTDDWKPGTTYALFLTRAVSPGAEETFTPLYWESGDHLASYTDRIRVLVQGGRDPREQLSADEPIIVDPGLQLQIDLGFKWITDGPPLVVAAVAPSSAAAEAGFQSGDTLTAIERIPVPIRRLFEDRVAHYAPGSRLLIQGIRNAQTLEKKLALPHPAAIKWAPPALPTAKDGELKFQGGLWLKSGQRFSGFVTSRYGGEGWVEAEYQDGAPLAYTSLRGDQTRASVEFVEGGRAVRKWSCDLHGHPVAELTYRDGNSFEGRIVGFHPNGLKQYEAIYREGKRIREEYWNEEGQLLEGPLLSK